MRQRKSSSVLCRALAGSSRTLLPSLEYFPQCLVSRPFLWHRSSLCTQTSTANETAIPTTIAGTTSEQPNENTQTQPPAPSPPATPVFSLKPTGPPTPKVSFDWCHVQTTPLNTPSVRIMTYNVLSSSISDSVADISYRRVPKEKIAFGWRGARVLEQILEHKPDVLCMQEVDKFEPFFDPELTKLVRVLFYFCKVLNFSIRVMLESSSKGVAQILMDVLSFGKPKSSNSHNHTQCITSTKNLLRAGCFLE